jgi:branched-chain amino acid transport system ATP-binding protein
MFKVIREIHAEGMAVLLVEQNIGMALEVAQRAAIIEEGRIVTTGTPAQLLAEPRLRQVYLGLDGP